jgi:rsbT co-antagonist protein RsbR
MFIARGDPYDEFLVEQSSLDVAETLAQLEREERERHEQLEVLVEQRTQEMRRAVEDLQQAQRAMRDQARAIEELSTPVVQLWKGILMVPLVGSIDDRRAQRLVETLLTAISEHEADTVLLDITGVTTVDTVVANHLIRTIQAARLLGAHPMLVGISAEIAQTLVTLGVDLSTIPTSANVEQGLQASFRTIGLRITQA